MPFQVQTSELRISVPGSVLWRHKDALLPLKFTMKKINYFRQNLTSSDINSLWKNYIT